MRVLLTIVAAAAIGILAGCTSAEERFEEGNLYYTQGNYDAALRCYREARQDAPALTGIDEKIRLAEYRLYIQRGDAAVGRGDWNAAEREYGEARRLDPEGAEIAGCFQKLTETRANAHFRRGQELVAANDPFDAVTEFEQALTFQPGHTRAREALERARADKADRESRAQTLYEAGRQAWSQGRHEAAMQEFQRALDQDARHPGAQRELATARTAYAQLLLEQGEQLMREEAWTQAAATFRKAQQFAPRNRQLARRIREADNEAQTDEVAAQARDAARRREWGAAFDFLAKARALTGNPSRFNQAYDTARRRYAEQLYTAAQQADRARRLEEADRAYGRIQEFYAGYRDVAETRVRIQAALRAAAAAYATGCYAQEMHDLLTAESQFQSCLQQSATFRDAPRRLAQVRTGLGHAQDLYQRAAVAEAHGRLQEAQALFQQCLAVATPYGAAAERLERIQKTLAGYAEADRRYAQGCRAQKARNLERAREHFNACLKLRPGYGDAEKRRAEVAAGLAMAYRILERAAQAEAAGELDRAVLLYEESLAIATPCRDAGPRLEELRTAIRQLEEARAFEREKRLLRALDRYRCVLKINGSVKDARGRAADLQKTCDYLEYRHRDMVKARKAGRFRQALSTAVEIQEHCRGFKDVDAQAAVIASEADYQDGAALEEQGRYDEAIRHYELCAERTPDFKDVKARVGRCRKEKQKRNNGKQAGRMAERPVKD